MSELCADPACAQIREWYLADEVKLAKIRTCANKPGYYPEERLKEIRRILDGEPQP